MKTSRKKKSIKYIVQSVSDNNTGVDLSAYEDIAKQYGVKNELVDGATYYPNRTKKRNNYTLSPEAQKIVDKIPNYKKSGWVSNAIVIYNCNHKSIGIMINGNHGVRCVICGYEYTLTK